MTRLISIIKKDVHGILGLASQAQGTLKDVGVERRLTGADSEAFSHVLLLYTGNNPPGIFKWPCIVNFGYVAVSAGWRWEEASTVEARRGRVPYPKLIGMHMPSVLLRRGRVH